MNRYYDENGNEHLKPEGIEAVWRISGYAFIKEQGKLLMVKSTYSHLWELPGGGIEISESINEGVLRECWEETGYKVKVEDQPIHLGERNFYSTQADKFYRVIIMIFRGIIADPIQHKEVINTVKKNEIAAVEWVEITKLKKEEVHPTIWPAVSREIES